MIYFMNEKELSEYRHFFEIKQVFQLLGITKIAVSVRVFLEQNTKGTVIIHPATLHSHRDYQYVTKFCFEQESDALMFKLKYAEYIVQ